MGFCTSGSAAKTVALNPGGSLNARAASSAGIGEPGIFSELYGAGKSAARSVAARTKRKMPRTSTRALCGFGLELQGDRSGCHGGRRSACPTNRAKRHSAIIRTTLFLLSDAPEVRVRADEKLAIADRQRG